MRILRDYQKDLLDKINQNHHKKICVQLATGGGKTVIFSELAESYKDKAIIYDNCLRESDQLQRENSKIKSAFAGNIPPEQQLILDRNNERINLLVKRLESLFS